jgi:hypothetical protein
LTIFFEKVFLFLRGACRVMLRTPRSFVLQPHATGSAECRNNRRSDACNHLQDKLHGFFSAHSTFNV